MRMDFVGSMGPCFTDSPGQDTNNQTNPGPKGDARDEEVKPKAKPKSNPKK